jgi:hypothetical protein
MSPRGAMFYGGQYPKGLSIHTSASFNELEHAIGATLANGGVEPSPRIYGRTPKYLHGTAFRYSGYHDQYSHEMPTDSGFLHSPTHVMKELSAFIGELESRALVIFHSALLSPNLIRNACQKFGVLHYLKSDFHSRGVTFLSYIDLRSAIKAHDELRQLFYPDYEVTAHYSVDLNEGNQDEEARLLLSEATKNISEESVHSALSKFGELRSIQRFFLTSASSSSATSPVNPEGSAAAGAERVAADSGPSAVGGALQQKSSFTVEYFSIQDANLALKQLAPKAEEIWGPGAKLEHVPMNDKRRSMLVQGVHAVIAKWTAAAASSRMLASPTISAGSPDAMSDMRRVNSVSSDGSMEAMAYRGLGGFEMMQARVMGYPAYEGSSRTKSPRTTGGQVYGSTAYPYPATHAQYSHRKPAPLGVPPPGGLPAAGDVISPEAAMATAAYHYQQYLYYEQRQRQHQRGGAQPHEYSRYRQDDGGGGRPAGQFGGAPYMTQYESMTAAGGESAGGPPREFRRQSTAQAMRGMKNGGGGGMGAGAAGGGASSRRPEEDKRHGAPEKPPSTAPSSSDGVIMIGSIPVPEIGSSGPAAGGESSDATKFLISTADIKAGRDDRTTVMVRNIPNKYSQAMLLDEIRNAVNASYDFFYLPIDFRNRCNVGYAFINFSDPANVVDFFTLFNGRRWAHFNSEKVCAVTYARIQGKAALISRFQNSSLLDREDSYRPLLFYSVGHPLSGHPEPFPVPSGHAQGGGGYMGGGHGGGGGGGGYRGR